MDFKIGMLAKQVISEFEDVTPLIEPLACCLRSSCLTTHCSSCFRLIEGDLSPITNSFLTYCSPQCFDADFPIFSKSGEYELLVFMKSKSNPKKWPSEDHVLYRDNSFLRIALRLLLLLDPLSTRPFVLPRIFGLSSNNTRSIQFIEEGAYLMAGARASRDGTVFLGMEHANLERHALSLVITNALRISLGTSVMPIGLALYDWRISWINHSCRPNSYVRFVDAFQPQSNHNIQLAIKPSLSNDGPRFLDLLIADSAPRTVSQIRLGCVNYGPRAAVQTIHPLQPGDEVTITYIDASQPEVIRRSKLMRDYNFVCSCRRCSRLDVEGEHDRLLSVPVEKVIYCPMMRDYRFLCRCRRCLGLKGELEDDDLGMCLAVKLVSSILQHLELDDQDIVAEEPPTLLELKGNTPIAPKLEKNKKSLIRSASSITRRVKGAILGQESLSRSERFPNKTPVSESSESDRSIGVLFRKFWMKRRS